MKRRRGRKRNIKQRGSLAEGRAAPDLEAVHASAPGVQVRDGRRLDTPRPAPTGAGLMSTPCAHKAAVFPNFWARQTKIAAGVFAGLIYCLIIARRKVYPAICADQLLHRPCPVFAFGHPIVTPAPAPDVNV